MLVNEGALMTMVRASFVCVDDLCVRPDRRLTICHPSTRRSVVNDANQASARNFPSESGMSNGSIVNMRTQDRIVRSAIGWAPLVGLDYQASVQRTCLVRGCV